MDKGQFYQYFWSQFEWKAYDESTVPEKEDGTIDNTKKGGVYGGGQASAVTGNTHKVIVNLKDNTEVDGDVFGGGDQGEVEGSTKVNVMYTEPTSGE